MARIHQALLIGLIALSGLTPVYAQNMSQIAKVRRGESCPHCNLFQADMTYLKVEARNFIGARLRQADFSGAVMPETQFTGADLRDLNAYGAILTKANFSHANLTNASFVGAYLEGAMFRDADLEGVNFAGADMKSARGLTNAQLAAACGDAATRLPPGLHLKPCS